MASGVLTLGAAMGLHLAQIACNRRPGLREWLEIAALGAVTLVMARMVLDAPGLTAWGRTRVSQFAAALFQFASWPPPFRLGLVIGAPSLIFCILTFANRPALNDPRWFNVGAYGWVLTQFLALAAGRAEIGVQSRYSDMLLIGLAINLTSAFWLSASVLRPAKGKIWPYLGPPHGWPSSGPRWRMQRATCRETWRTGGKSPLPGQEMCGPIWSTGGTPPILPVPAVEIPYFESNRLRELLDAPEASPNLPPELLSRDVPDTWVEAFKRTSSARASPCSGPALSCLSPSLRGKAGQPPRESTSRELRR